MKNIDATLLAKFDTFLSQKSLTLTASVIGGTAIVLVARNSRTTQDVDSLTKLPEEIVKAIAEFAKENGLPANWFNDNASRNFKEFVRDGDEIFAKKIFNGKQLTLFIPDMKTLIISKIYPILDREALDLKDIGSLIKAGAVTSAEFDAAVAQFENDIRFEEDASLRKKSRTLVDLLKKFKGTQTFPE